MALLPQEPKQQRALIAIVAAVGLFYAFWSYVYTPRQEALAEERDRLERLETRNRAAQVRALQKERLEQQAAVYERYVRRLEELVPAAEEVPALIRDITAEARRLDVDLNLIEPQADVPEGPYTRQSYSMRVIGEYHDVGRFLTSVASLPRIITPVELTVSSYNDNQGLMEYEAPVEADFRIETYVVAPAGSQPPPQGAAGPGGEG